MLHKSTTELLLLLLIRVLETGLVPILQKLLWLLLWMESALLGKIGRRRIHLLLILLRLIGHRLLVLLYRIEEIYQIWRWTLCLCQSCALRIRSAEIRFR